MRGASSWKEILSPPKGALLLELPLPVSRDSLLEAPITGTQKVSAAPSASRPWPSKQFGTSWELGTGAQDRLHPTVRATQGAAPLSQNGETKETES